MVLSVSLLDYDSELQNSFNEHEIDFEQRIKGREERGKIEVYRGKPEYWDVLDDSFDKESRDKVQKQVRSVSSELNRVFGEEEKDETIDCPIGSKYIK